QSGARLGQARAGKARAREPQVAHRLRRSGTRRDRQHRAALLGCAAGALGERKPDVVSLDPSWHHNYASLAWTGGSAEEHHAAHYPAIKPELVELTSALHGLAHDPGMRAEFLKDAAAFADRFHLPPQQREALIKLDLPAMVKMGAHPLVPFLAQLQMRRAQ